MSADAGYSGTPLAKKLGFAPGKEILVVYVTSRAELEERLPVLREGIAQDASLWVAWPKKASGVPTDLTEDVQREIWLPLGLVDTKVCAIDDVWSGLRLCWRKELRDDVRAGRWPAGSAPSS